jgi:hypothetical protein
MPFKLTTSSIDTLTPPPLHSVARWLWQVEKGTSPMVKNHGQAMLDTFFDSIDAAKEYVTLKNSQL